MRFQGHNRVSKLTVLQSYVKFTITKYSGHEVLVKNELDQIHFICNLPYKLHFIVYQSKYSWTRLSIDHQEVYLKWIYYLGFRILFYIFIFLPRDSWSAVLNFGICQYIRKYATFSQRH